MAKKGKQKSKSLFEPAHLFHLFQFRDSIMDDCTGLAEREISAAINQGLDKNFYAFVNEFRVEEVKTRLVDTKYGHLTILSIAFEAGFNSKATFNRIFKAYTGISPKAYQEANGIKRSQ